jgi:DNA polymerase III epsilon subunit-like protein
MLHLNGDLLCAIDCETTGTKAGFHEIIQICVLPLDFNLQPLKRPGVSPFYTEMKPECLDRIDWEAIKVSRLELPDILARALDKYRAADLFDKWVAKLELPYRKRIVPLGCNWPFDREFIKDWLGDECYSQYFDARHRDVQTAALYLNDKYDFHCEPYPFPKVNLSYLASQLRVKYERKHDALFDCLATAEVYRRMLRNADYMHTPDELAKRLRPYVKQGENAVEALERILQTLPKESE